MKKRLWFILCLIFVAANLAVAQTKTVTNADLEKHRQKRLQAEKEYRENYSKLGFPSPEELEKQNEKSRIEREQLSQRLEAKQRENETDFQSRANILRSDIASIDAQIAYLRGELNNLPENRIKFYSSNYFPLPNTTFPPYYQNGTGYYSAHSAGRISINTSSVRIRTNSVPVISTGNQNNWHGRRFYRGRYNNYGYYPFVANNNSYERDEIVSGLRQLEQTRAGLLAEWNVLEDEARRAGVRIE